MLEQFLEKFETLLTETYGTDWHYEWKGGDGFIQFTMLNIPADCEDEECDKTESHVCHEVN